MKKSLVNGVYSRPPHGGRGLKYNFYYNQPKGQSRPPHGGRGLKSLTRFEITCTRRVALPTEGVD